MTASRVWTVAVVGMAAFLGALLFIVGDSPLDAMLGVTGIVVLVGAWFVFGVRRVDDSRGAPLLIVAVAIAAALLVSAAPTLAIVQGIAYPIAWVFTSSTRRAIVANSLIALGVTIGFVFRLGTTPDALLQTAFTVVVSLGFSMAMGFWIAHMNRLGERNGRLLAELQGAQSQIAALHREAGATAEREHLARELHDTIAQDLTGLVMLAQRAQRERGSPETLALIEESARSVLADTRALVAAGAAVGEPGEGLAATLGRLAARFERETGVQVHCTVQNDLVLSRDVDVVVLRCVQEALGNARKHARASRISIDVGHAPGDRNHVRVNVTDDGIGFEPANAESGFGLSGLTERLALVRGELTVQSSPGSGTTLVALLPTGRVMA